MTIRELRDYLVMLDGPILDSPVWVDGCEDLWEVAAVSLCHRPIVGPERHPLILLPAHIALPMIPLLPAGQPGFHPDYWTVVGITRARIRAAGRAQLLDLMDRMAGRPADAETMRQEDLRMACIVQFGAWSLAQACASQDG